MADFMAQQNALYEQNLVNGYAKQVFDCTGAKFWDIKESSVLWGPWGPSDVFIRDFRDGKAPEVRAVKVGNHLKEGEEIRGLHLTVSGDILVAFGPPEEKNSPPEEEDSGRTEAAKDDAARNVGALDATSIYDDTINSDSDNVDPFELSAAEQATYIMKAAAANVNEPGDLGPWIVGLLLVTRRGVLRWIDRTSVGDRDTAGIMFRGAVHGNRFFSYEEVIDRQPGILRFTTRGLENGKIIHQTWRQPLHPGMLIAAKARLDMRVVDRRPILTADQNTKIVITIQDMTISVVDTADAKETSFPSKNARVLDSLTDQIWQLNRSKGLIRVSHLQENSQYTSYQEHLFHNDLNSEDLNFEEAGNGRKKRSGKNPEKVANYSSQSPSLDPTRNLIFRVFQEVPDNDGRKQYFRTDGNYQVLTNFAVIPASVHLGGRKEGEEDMMQSITLPPMDTKGDRDLYVSLMARENVEQDYLGMYGNHLVYRCGGSPGDDRDPRVVVFSFWPTDDEVRATMA
ncbi:hypothetical protein MMC19_004671 [Ptychographa xylographoides]|nr:hypothetical protein [Ptychographa xylographoides]